MVVGLGFTFGVGTVAYGASNMGEAEENIRLGSKGDGTTQAKNLIRDTIFFGDEKWYHQSGQFFTTGSSIMIPVGQTGSFVIGGIQFLAGEFGGLVGCQIGYHGSKAFGFSEQDARNFQLLGTIAGGYAGSKGGEKFSLNKPLKNFKDPELMAQLSNSGHKYNPDDIILVAKNSDGNLLWLETGTDSAGLQHIIIRHSDDFSWLGIKDIPSFLDEALGLSPIKSGIGGRGPYSIYEINGRNYILAYGDNGFIVSFYPSK